MSIIDKIKETVESVIGKGRFLYNDGDGLNYDLDNQDFPCAFAQLVEAGTVLDQLGLFHEKISIGIFFADLADVDTEPLANERILDSLKKKAFSWMAAAKQSEYFKSVEPVSTDRVYIKQDGYDVRLTAFVVYVSIEEQKGYGICDIVDCGC